MNDILELSALAPVREKARIRTEADPDGTLYELAVPDDFGAIDLRKLGNAFAEVEEIFGADKDPTKAQEKRVNLLLDRLTADLILDVPADVVAALPYATKRSLAMRFFAGLGDEMLTIMGTRAQALAGTLES